MTGYIIILVIGLVVLIIFGRNILQGQKSRSWPTVSGTILQSSLEVHHQTDDDGSTSTTYGVMVSYQYSVSGQEFVGNRRTFSNVRTGSRRRAEALLARYPQGGQVDVFYDPQDPSTCVLETGVSGGTYALLAFVVVLVLIGLAGVLGIIG
jgi:hypothetical protein